MSDDTNQVGWTEEQWNQIRKTVADEAQKARVAAQFLPLFGPVDPALVAVPDLTLTYAPLPVPPGAAAPGAPAAGAPPAPQRIMVSSAPTIYLATISVQVSLANHEVADGELMSALGAFRRAANIVARVEDALVFDGQPGAGLPPRPVAGLPPVYQVTGGGAQPGLVPPGAVPNPAPAAIPPLGGRSGSPYGPLAAAIAAGGVPVVNSLVTLIGNMEAAGQSGPYACFLSQNLFDIVHTPNASMVMPRDRILPFLGGDYLRRTNTIPNGYGIVVALGGAPVELVVASDICVRFLQITQEPRFLFRVSERLALRVKEWNAVGVLHP